MKALTVRQPWAQLIVEGVKPIENRTWPCPKKYIGQRVLIHAGAIIDKNAIEVVSTINGELSRTLWFDINDNSIQRGAIIGSVKIVDCVVNHHSIWAEKTPYLHLGKLTVECQKPIYNWVLANPIRFPEPIPVKGRLGFWDYPNILAEPEEKNGDLFCHCQLPIKEENQVMSLGDGHYYCRYCGGKWYK